MILLNDRFTCVSKGKESAGPYFVRFSPNPVDSQGSIEVRMRREPIDFEVGENYELTIKTAPVLR